MNNKQLIPLLVKLGIAGGIVWAFASLFSGNDADNKTETEPADTEAKNRRKVAETAVFRQIPAEIPVKPTVAPVPAVIPANSGGKLTAPPPPAAIPANSVPVAPKIPVPMQPATIPVAKNAAQAPLSAIKRKLITREDMATVFYRGIRALNRKDAVAALIGLGFGKSAAYAALSPDGRFSASLQFAPDGIITWRG